MTKPDIDMLAQNLNLSPYQRGVLRENYNEYDISRLVVRGGALYAPRRGKRAIFARARDIVLGRRADLIGVDKTLVRNRRGIKLYSGGKYSIDIGQYRLYADSSGRPTSR